MADGCLPVVVVARTPAFGAVSSISSEPAPMTQIGMICALRAPSSASKGERWPGWLPVGRAFDRGAAITAG